MSSPTVTQNQSEPSIAPSPPKEAKSFVEQIVTWASVSYAAGFFIVLLHTWRLGLPVLDLVQAVYVWIGIPLAAFAYFAKKLWGFFRRRLEAHSALLRSSLRKSSGVDDVDGAVAQILDVIAQVPPFFLSNFLTLRLLTWVLSRVREKLSSNANHEKAAAQLLHWGARVWGGLGALLSMINLVALAAMVAGTLLLYVWRVYPQLPQSLGGGAPARVRLVLDVTKVSPEFSQVSGLKASWSKDGPPMLTPELDLLYKTADGFWLRSEKGAPFLLDASMVLSLSYSDASGLTRR